MKTLAVNADNDIYMTANGLAIAEGAKCQSVVMDTLIKTQRGGLQFDKNEGIDYFGTIFQDANYLPMWATEVQSRVREFDWVKDIEDFKYEFDRSASTVRWSMVVLNTDGERIRLGTSMNDRSRSELEIDLDWKSILDKPNGLEEALAILERMRKAAGDKRFLVKKDTLAKTKETVNDAVLRPLKTPLKRS